VGERQKAFRRALHHAIRARNGGLERQLVMEIAQGLDWGPTPVEQAIGECAGLLAERPGDLLVEAACKVVLGVLEAMKGNFEEARNLVTRGRAIWVEFGNNLGVLRASECRRLVEMHAGDFAAAAEETRSALRTLEEMGERSWLSSRAGFLAEAEAAQGHYDEADRLVAICRQTAAADDVEAQALWRQVLGRIMAGRGRHIEAARLAREAVSWAERTDALSWRGMLLLNEGRILQAAGRDAEAARAAERALALFEAKGDVVGAERARALLACGESAEGN
jgi:tetratricopeptide (TPR) repeat protein